ncbi:glycosyl transferase family 2 [Nocardioides sp. S5]|uniref:glycosyltransferase n=1 Tax=Nocardioides sp. S5 TaxID=2017486 RepID=UPI001A8CEEFC|nr:glycosyltransferase family 2 protein [Nocardioides sp. S5]QSR32551.1 glycosyl transferase family 2 [Nocardioides sp. S5]
MSEHVVVVVVTFGSADVVPGLVASLGPGMGEVPWHLVVADNASTDDTLAVVRRVAPDATVLDLPDNRGYAAGINAAVAAAPPHSAVLVLNPDVRLQPECVPTLLAAMRRTRAGIVVPRLQDARGELIHSMRREPTVLRTLGDAFLGATRAGRRPLLGEVVTDPRAYEHEQDVDWAEGSTQLVDAECWQTCGAWDEGYFLYSEETEFHLRAGDRGLAVRYVPSAGAVHLEGASATSTRLWPLLVANRWRLFRARHGAAHSAAFWAALLAREGSRAVLGHVTCRRAARVLLRPSLMRAPRGPEWLDAVSASA